MMLQRTILCGALMALWGVVGGWGTIARADLIITVGNIQLKPNTDNQPVPLYVTTNTGQTVQAVQVQVLIGNGGAAYGDAQPEPTINSLDVVDNPDCIFHNDNNGESPLSPSTGVIMAQLASRGTITSPTGATSVLANGVFATVYISTLGCTTPGASWTLSLTGTKNTDTVFGDLVPTITNGTITIAPEPASALLVGAGAALLLRRRRRLPTGSA